MFSYMGTMLVPWARAACPYGYFGDTNLPIEPLRMPEFANRINLLGKPNYVEGGLIMRLCCPACGSIKTKRNGHIHNPEILVL